MLQSVLSHWADLSLRTPFIIKLKDKIAVLPGLHMDNNSLKSFTFQFQILWKIRAVQIMSWSVVELEMIDIFQLIMHEEREEMKMTLANVDVAWSLRDSAGVGYNQEGKIQ